MQTKKCFKCGRELPLSEFYKHPQIGDGHLNKCKECTKRDARKVYKRNSADEDWMERERIRGREKFKRLNYLRRFKKTRDLCPNNGNISRKLRVRGYSTEGLEAHHWNYNSPESVFLLSRKAHKRLHLHLTVNREDKYCYTEDGERLETIEQAKEYFQSILYMYNLKEDFQIVDLNQ